MEHKGHAAVALEIGELIENKYRLVRLLGSGGWGSVYEGENIRTLHRVAIKVLHREMSSKTDMVARFEREAQAAGKIGSEHIIEVYDLGELQTTGEHFMVMEFLDGEDLASRIQRFGSLEPEEAAPLLAQVLEGLAAAHEAGILHRDLKPENLFLVKSKTGGDFVKILDFGISKFGTLGNAGAKMTQTGAVMGSPCYMSPEQARGSKDLDARSDLFSIGVVLFECTTGRLPYEGDNFNELLFKIALNDAPDPASVMPDLDPEFAAIIRKALTRDTASRFQSAREFQAEIYGWMERHGVSRDKPVLRKSRTPRSSGKMTPSNVGSSPAISHSDTVALPGSVRSQPVAARSGSGSGERRVSPTQVSPLAKAGTSPELVQVMPPSQRTPQRKVLTIAVPVLGLLLIGGVALALHRGDATKAAAAADTATSTVTTPTPTTTEATTASATATTDSTNGAATANGTAPTAPTATATEEAASATATGPAATARRGQTAATGKTTTGRGTTAAATGGNTATATTATAAATTAATAAATTTASGKAVETVEGRRIRTGL